MNLLRVRTLVAKEVNEALRDRLYLTLAFFLPILLMLVFTYGMTSNIDNVGVVIVDEDQNLTLRRRNGPSAGPKQAQLRLAQYLGLGPPG